MPLSTRGHATLPHTVLPVVGDASEQQPQSTISNQLFAMMSELLQHFAMVEQCVDVIEEGPSTMMPTLPPGVGVYFLFLFAGHTQTCLLAKLSGKITVTQQGEVGPWW
jgi:hypothetical protein